MDRVVVGMFARAQTSLRSATLRVFLWIVRRRKERRDEVIDAQLCLHSFTVTQLERKKGGARDV